MAATEGVRTFSDIYTDLLNRCREATGETPTTNQAKRYANTGLLDMHIGTAEKLPWAERQSHLITQPSYSTGTVTITQGSTSLTGSSTLWDTANAWGVKNARAGGKIRVAGTQDTYTVSAVGSDTSITLSQKFVGSDVSAETYLYFEDDYALAADFGRPVDLRSFSDGYNISLIGRTEFRRRYPRNNVTGTISVATIYDDEFSSSTTPVRKIRFHHPPSSAQLIPYSYITRYLAVASDGTRGEQMSADTDEPIVPHRFRTAIVLRGLYWWYRDRTDDARSAEVLSEYNNMIAVMVGDNEIGDVRPKFRPNTTLYKSRAKRPWSGSGRRYDINGRFDRMEW